MLRAYQHTSSRLACTPELGSPDDPEGFGWIYAYSPLNDVRPDTEYPATLVITGDRDDRVVPFAYKFTAALQAAQVGPAPILLCVVGDSGHWFGIPISKQRV